MTSKLITILPNIISSSRSHESIRNVKAKQLQSIVAIDFLWKMIFRRRKCCWLNFLQFMLSKVIRVPALEKLLSERLRIGRLTHGPGTMLSRRI